LWIWRYNYNLYNYNLQRAAASIRGNGIDAYPVKRALPHFLAQRIIARKQYPWTKKTHGVQMAVSGIDPESTFTFRATAPDH